MKTRPFERGQTTIMMLFCLLGLLSFSGLALDVGLLFHARRTIQAAADAAAIAGASEYTYSTKFADINSAAQAAATLNGYTNGQNGTVVTINNPAKGGQHKGVNTVEAIVSQPQSNIFLSLLGWPSTTVAARAVAFNGATNTSCIDVMSSTASPGMLLQGNFTVNAPSCGVVVNSTDPNNAAWFKGTKGTLTAGSVGVVGGLNGQVTDSNPPAITGVPPISDPMIGKITAPTYSGCTAPSGGTLTGSVSNGGTVCYSGSVNINNAVLAAGTYVFTGNVTFNGNVTGTGVTLYLLGNLTALTNSVLNLTAPTTGSYSGILIYGASTATGSATTNTGTLSFDVGTASGSLTGIIYAPGMTFFLQDHGSGTVGLSLTTDLIVNTLDDQASTLNMTSYSKTNPNSTPLTKVALVE